MIVKFNNFQFSPQILIFYFFALSPERFQIPVVCSFDDCSLLCILLSNVFVVVVGDLAHVKLQQKIWNVLNDSHGSHRGTAFFYSTRMLAQGAALQTNLRTLFPEEQHKNYGNAKKRFSYEITFCSNHVSSACDVDGGPASVKCFSAETL